MIIPVCNSFYTCLSVFAFDCPKKGEKYLQVVYKIGGEICMNGGVTVSALTCLKLHCYNLDLSLKQVQDSGRTGKLLNKAVIQTGNLQSESFGTTKTKRRDC